MRGQESVKFSNIAATTSAFELRGGRYLFTAVATFGGGSVGLETLAADQTTWLTCLTALTVAGGAVLDLAPGQYRFTVSTATAVYASVARVPLE